MKAQNEVIIQYISTECTMSPGACRTCSRRRIGIVGNMCAKKNSEQLSTRSCVKRVGDGEYEEGDVGGLSTFKRPFGSFCVSRSSEITFALLLLGPFF